MSKKTKGDPSEPLLVYEEFALAILDDQGKEGRRTKRCQNVNVKDLFNVHNLMFFKASLCQI